MPPDAKKSITRLYNLLAKLPIEGYLSSENFSAFCREHDLTDTWKEHFESLQDRPDLYGKEINKNAFILFFQHLFQTRKCEFLELLTGFLYDFRKWNANSLPLDAIKKECIRLGFSDETVEGNFKTHEQGMKYN